MFSLAVQDFERYRTVAHRDLLGGEDTSDGARAQSADKARTGTELTGKLCFGFRCLRGERSAVARKELKIIGVGLLASAACLHGRR